MTKALDCSRLHAGIPLLCCFTIGIFLSGFSWFFLLGSSTHPSSIKHSTQTGWNIFSVVENQSTPPHVESWDQGSCSVLDSNGPQDQEFQRFADRAGPCTAVRVMDPRDADIVFVPFFSSLSYYRHSKVKPPAKVSRNHLLQKKLIEYLMVQEKWKKSEGMGHHPNSMLDARMKLWPCISFLLILGGIFRLWPMWRRMSLLLTFVNDSAGFDDPPTLMFFRGAIYKKYGCVELDVVEAPQEEVKINPGVM